MMLDTDKIIVINWFDKEDLEGVLDKKISQEEYDQFRVWLGKTGMYDEGSVMIREYYGNYVDDHEGK